MDVSYSPSAGNVNSQLKAERAAREAEARLFHGRRQFAAIALKEHLATLNLLGDGISESLKNKVVKRAYDWADMMLAEEKERYGS